jgi:hypothetical protein
MAAIKVVFWSNVVVAFLVFVFSSLLLFTTIYPDPRDPHGGMYGLIGLAFLIPTGLLFSLIAYAINKNWKYKWILQASPLLIIAVVILS